MKSKRELLFFIENYTGRNVDIKEMSHPKKHARTYMNRFIISEDDQYEISTIEEMDSDWEFKEGPRPENIHDRIQELIRRISAESLDIFFFGWYEFQVRPTPLSQERFHCSLNHKGVRWTLSTKISVQELANNPIEKIY